MRDNYTVTKQDSNQYTFLLHHFSYITNLAPVEDLASVIKNYMKRTVYYEILLNFSMILI
jgi:hypothetical protein